ncbi:MAG: acetyltransferase [Halomonas sp. 54_146]|nr:MULTISPECIES: GNAT family N-acetyltransferase [unclassified Halomonas]KUJ86532.1 MAG: acetyltransferase [Halomonas sp. 54_146]HAA44774.1 N-acetyltransferase [Halomonas sp.]
MSQGAYLYSAATGKAVFTCPQAVRREALWQLAAAHTPRGQAELAAAINHMLEQADANWGGLLITQDEHGHPTGAVWVEVLPGNEATLWRPQNGCNDAPALLRAAIGWAKQQRLSVVKTVLEANERQTAALLEANGFPKVVSLHYLSASTQTVLNAPAVEAATHFTPVKEVAPERLEAVLGQVAQGSLDCPELQGRFTAQQALQGFYRQDAHAPAQWYLVRCEGEDAGVLLLAPHPEANHWEVMYMGLAPAWRGRGLGKHVVNEALRQAANAGVEEVILAVDKRNTPAQALYQRAGFVLRATCDVHGWLTPSPSEA